MRVIVIGAGLGGLTLAHGLRRAGIDVVVYERDSAQGRPQGVSLQFDDRAMTALRACLSPQHVAMVEATMGGQRDRIQFLSEVDGELEVVRTRPSPRPGRQVNRRLLRAIMLTGLENTVRFGAEFTRFEQQADGTVQAWFADGSTDRADVLVGADGIGSAVRRQHLPDVQVVDTGKRMLMGATPLRAVAGTGLPDLIGHNPGNAKGMVLAVHRFAEPVTDAEDYVMWALPFTQERPASATELARELHPTLRLVVDEAWQDVTVALRLGMIPPLPEWPAGPVTLLGDALHAAPGFGGNLATQDAHRLRDALAKAARGEQDLLTAIGEYEDAARRVSA
ncbi:NAD(P)/FAD-dependent oxidoreductase [Kibdelosporangium persicum]|uniref:FAD dependent oxidoreductase n=1 Tax=Kibdelosporangium persicum TaxID=2698649 RepID=A0ABX2FEE3_9PSEU|nr:NAD(P)/FAD-dependent oxidoreductase [Kibdelosporangium persicum]NRN69603.1 FAD dependent oxidoreductase [Kibdelosporangium persicum]